MAQELIDVLSNSILPMVERLDKSRLVLPEDAGKASFGPYPPPEDLAPSERGMNFPSARVGSYAGHAQSVEWVLGFSGDAELALAGRRYELSGGDLAVIPPEVPHLERILHQDQGYHIIWLLAYLNRDRVTLHSSSYSGGNRFQFVSGARFEGRADLCRLFLRGAEEALHRNTGWESLIRSIAVDVVVQLIRHLQEHGLGQTPQQHRGTVVDYAKSYIQSHYADPLNLKDIAQAVFLSPSYFSSLFTRSAGMTVFEYVQQVRVDEARRLLAESELAVTKVARHVGFLTRSHFTRSFRRHVGCSPREYRRKAAMRP